ncbi:MAG: hypothetical protein K8W52_16260 [Deltaproteobacteria bacterium]|nr:hypothetical protein [Deltaproteobacteria bacterium]
MRLVRVLPSLAPRPAPPREDYNVDAIRALAFAPDATDLIVLGRFALARWALDDARPRWRRAHAARWGGHATFTPDGAALYTIGDDERLVERDPATGAERRCLDPACHVTAALVVSADGRDLAWAGSSVPGNPGGYSRSAARLWDVATAARRWEWSGPDWCSASGLAIAADDVRVVAGRGRAVALARADGAERAHHALVDGGQIHAIRRGRAIVASGETPTRAWLQLRTGGTLALRRELAIAAAEPVAIDPIGRFAAVTQGRSEVAIVSLARMQAIETLRLADPDLDRPTALALRAGLLAVGTVGGQVHVLAPRALA